MITELKVENFNSFGSDMAHLSLRPLNFIVGANASGKTNLLSALRFLKIALLQNVDIAVGEFEGPGEV
jgi:AAA15 family ATPase/GTPase